MHLFSQGRLGGYTFEACIGTVQVRWDVGEVDVRAAVVEVVVHVRFREVLDASEVFGGDGSGTWRIRVLRRLSSNLVEYAAWVVVHSTAFSDGSCTQS